MRYSVYSFNDVGVSVDLAYTHVRSRVRNRRWIHIPKHRYIARKYMTKILPLSRSLLFLYLATPALSSSPSKKHPAHPQKP
jgi:hypothetical protein